MYDSIERGKSISSIVSKCTYHNFPTEGVDFIDVFPILSNGYPKDCEEAFNGIPLQPVVFVPESRGFVFYDIFRDSFVPLRKKGKLPGFTNSYSSTKEYGEDVLEFKPDHVFQLLLKKNWPSGTTVPVAFADDVLATGQTAESFIKFINRPFIGGVNKDIFWYFKVQSIYCYVEISKLNARERLKEYGVDLYSVYTI